MSRIAHKLISASGGEDAYEIEQSILLNHDDSSYLWYEPGAGGSRTTWTFSGWFKPGPQPDGYFGVFGHQAGSGASWYQNDLSFNDAANMKLDWQGNRSGSSRLITNRRFRDQTGWYHIVFAVDTTQGTASNRMKLYINGVQETSFSTETYPGSSENLFILKNGDRVNIGRIQETYFGEGYVAEVHVVDGSQLAPTSFGEVNSTTGQWVPIEYEGSHGTQGSYLKFASGAIGTDSSGNGNNWTAVNLANSDVMLDTPTNNYCTLNGNQTYNSDTGKLSQGNLFLAAGTYASGHYSNISSTFNVPGSGKWYAECRISIEAGAGNVTFFGVTDQEINWDGVANENLAGADGLFSSIYLNYIKVCDSGNIGTGNTSATASSYILGMALDVDNGYAYFGVDSGSAMVWYKADGSTSGGDPTSGSTGTGGFARTFTTDDTITVSTSVSSSGGDGSQNHLNFGQNGTFCGTETAGGNADGNGRGNFFRSPPSGYLALCSQNLPTPTIKKSSEHFNTKLYTGNGATAQEISLDFNPDLVWIKSRSDSEHHSLVDRLRGDVAVNSNQNIAEYAVANFDWNTNNTVDVPVYANTYSMNTNSDNYVMWHWKANGSGSSNEDGSINTTATSVNTTAGFSISTYTGTGSTATVGHGLGVVPSVIIIKNRGQTDDWAVYSRGDATDYLELNTNSYSPIASTDDNTYWNDTAPTSSVFTIGTAHSVNASSETYVAYCFANVEGFFKSGTYTGNGEAENGPVVYTGFSPALVIVKEVSSAGGSWFMWDNKREVGNVKDAVVWADYSNAETSHATYEIDVLSNGFKLRGDNGGTNQNGETMLYMAWAESPFKYATAR